jgi:hypothetical protein
MISPAVLVFVSRLESEITPQPELKEIAKADMQQLMTLVRYTGVSITYFDKAFSAFIEKIPCVVTFLCYLLMFVGHAICLLPISFLIQLLSILVFV